MQPGDMVPATNMIFERVPIGQIAFKRIISGGHQVFLGIFPEVNLLQEGGRMIRLVLGKIGLEAEDGLVRIFLYILLRRDHIAKVGKTYSLAFDSRKLLRGSRKRLRLRRVSCGRRGRLGIAGDYSDGDAHRQQRESDKNWLLRDKLQKLEIAS